MVKIQLSKNELMLIFERHEKIIEGLLEVAKEYNIQGGVFNGIGGVTNMSVGTTSMTSYHSNDFKDDVYELTSLNGNMSMVDGKEPSVHCHVNFFDINDKPYGGHLFEAEVALTAEIYLKFWDKKSGVVFHKEQSSFAKHLKTISHKSKGFNDK